MFYGVGRFAVKFRWAVILFWALLLMASLFFAPRVVSQLKSGFGQTDTESRKGLELLQEELGSTESTVTLVFHSDALTVADPKYQTEVDRVLAQARDIPQVSHIDTFENVATASMVSSDGHTTYAIVFLNVSFDEAMELYPDMEERLLGGLSSSSDDEVEVWATGGVPIFSDLNKASERDLQRAEALSFPLVLVALVLVFGGLVAAGLPVAMGAVSVALALAALFFMAQVTDVSIFALNIASFLGLGVAVDYSLLVVSRFREELELHPKDEAVARTVAVAGRTLLFSGITSVIGLSGLLFFKFMMLRSIGLGGMVVIAISLLVALTLLPAILSVMGSRVNSLSLFPLLRGRGWLWHRLALWVMRHPLLVAVPLLVFLLLLGTPFWGVKVGAPWASILPPDAQARQGWEVVSEEMGPGELSPILVVARTQEDASDSAGGILQPASIATLYDLAETLEEDPRVERVQSLFTVEPSVTREQYQAVYADPSKWSPEVQEAISYFASNDTTVLQVFSHFSPVAPETKELVRDIRSMRPIGELELLVTGATADLVDSVDAMYGDFPKGILFVMGTIYLALLVLFRSVLIPLKAVVMNAMSIFASYGALVYIFQQGHFQRLLGFEAEGFTEATVPILMFFVIFGLSMDYEIFLLSRIKEHYDRGRDNTQSVALGLERTGRIITSAALILVLVAASFATGDVLVIKALGVGTAIAIFLDATVVRALLVPALMRIMGDWNWWAPAILRRILPRWQLSP